MARAVSWRLTGSSVYHQIVSRTNIAALACAYDPEAAKVAVFRDEMRSTFDTWDCDRLRCVRLDRRDCCKG